VRGRVLIADESAPSRLAARKIFESEGFTVFECTSGSDVVRLAKEHQPDVVFLDVETKRADPREVVNILERFGGTRSVVVILTCPRDIDATRLARLEATGALLVLVKPLTRDGLLGAFREALEESHRRKTKFEAPTQRKTTSTRHVRGNNSLLVKQLFCPFHETPVAVDAYVLRTGKIQTDANFYDMPVYRSAVAGADYVDYNLLGVAVCPRCLFASNFPGYFADPNDRKGVSVNHRRATISAIASGAGARMEHAGDVPADFFSENRSIDGAILSYELAVQCGQTLLGCNRHALAIELLRLGNYELRLAHLHAQKNPGNETGARHFEIAYEFLREGFTVLDGAPLYKAAYQLVALSISFGADRAAYQYLTRLNEISQAPLKGQSDRAALDRYLSRCRRAWEDRGDHRFPWIESAGDSDAVAAAAA
jgi:CheY-like chemotaxis protein